MSLTNTPNDIADNKTSVAKKGYSIWSLLVIMTLLAVWMVIPRTASIGKWSDGVLMLFILVHQITLWTLIGSIIWIVAGKRRTVIYLLAGILAIAWGPLAIVAVERHLFKSEYFVAWTVRTGLVDVLDPFYNWVFQAFDYEPK